MQPRQFEGWLVLFVHGLDFNLGRVRQERPDHYAGTVSQRVHPQQLMRRALFHFD